MSRAKGHLLNLLGGLVLSESTVLRVADRDGAFRVVDLSVEPSSKYQPGDKIQVVLPDKDVRTFTPIGWSDRTRLVVFRHDARTPAGRWIDGLAVGDTVRFIGPQRSLRMPDGPIALVGDETSIGVAAAYEMARPGLVDARFELGVGATETLAEVGLGRARLGPIDDISGPVGITGGGALIQRVRSALRQRGVRDLRVKAYWVAGKSGLD